MTPLEVIERENRELKEALKHFNPCCEWNDDVHACEYMVRAPEYARELEEAKRIVRFLLEYGRYEWIDPNSKEFEAFCDVKEKAEALVGGNNDTA